MSGIINSTSIGRTSGIIGNRVTYAASLVDAVGSATYATGTWTPDWRGTTGSAGSASTTIAHSGTANRYTKIGDMVHWSCGITWTNKGSWTGDCVIAGIPFAPDTTGYYGGAMGYIAATLGFGGSHTQLVPRVQIGSSFIALIAHISGAASHDVLVSDVSAGTLLHMSGWYRTSA